jgi:hypothetical protein
MKLINTLQGIGKANWETAAWVLIYAGIVGAVPILATLIIYLVSGNSDFHFLTDNGQLIIFSATLISSGLYFVAKDFKKTSDFPGRLGFLLILWGIEAIALIIFICITIDNTASEGFIAEWGIIRISSIVIPVVSLVIVYIAAAIHEWRTQEYFMVQTYKTGTGKLEEDFDQTGGSQ